MTASAGATLHEGEAVVAWQPTPEGGVRVETQQGVYTAQRLVLTAGAWLPELVPALQVGWCIQGRSSDVLRFTSCCEVSASAEGL